MPTDDKHDAILEWAERVREASEEATPGPWTDDDGMADCAGGLWSEGKRLAYFHHQHAPGEGRTNAEIAALAASPDIAAAVREVVVLSMEHMATLDDYRGGLDDEDPEYVGASYEAVLDAEYRYKEALDRLADVLRGREESQ